MAQVTMSNQEYMQLQRKADLFDTLFRQLVGNYKVSFEADSSWRPVRINVENEYDEELEKRIVTVVADQLAANPDAMDYLVKEDEYIFDVHRGETTSSRWESRMYVGQYDMRALSKAFEYEWAAAQVRNDPNAHEPGECFDEEEPIESFEDTEE